MNRSGMFLAGAVFATALTVSFFRRKEYSSFGAWWDAEGIGIWLLAGVIGGVLLLD